MMNISIDEKENVVHVRVETAKRVVVFVNGARIELPESPGPESKPTRKIAASERESPASEITETSGSGSTNRERRFLQMRKKHTVIGNPFPPETKGWQKEHRGYEVLRDNQWHEDSELARAMEVKNVRQIGNEYHNRFEIAGRHSNPRFVIDRAGSRMKMRFVRPESSGRYRAE